MIDSCEHTDCGVCSECALSRAAQEWDREVEILPSDRAAVVRYYAERGLLDADTETVLKAYVETGVAPPGAEKS